MSLFRIALTLAVLGTATPAAAGNSVSPGKVVFDNWCSACHAAGPGHPGTAGLAVKYGGKKPAELELRTDLRPDVVKYFVRNGFSVMAPFRKTEITDAELDALARYLAAPQAGGAKSPR